VPPIAGYELRSRGSAVLGFDALDKNRGVVNADVNAKREVIRR
jgi:hypothetical protein